MALECEKMEKELIGRNRFDNLFESQKNEHDLIAESLISLREIVSENLAQCIFPNEVWTLCGRVHVSEKRIEHSLKSRNAKEIFENEKKISDFLAEKGLSVWLLPENNVCGKNPDAIVDGQIAEFKYVVGGIKRIWSRLMDAAEQTDELVFIGTDKNFSVHDILRMIKGKFVQALRDNPSYSNPFPFESFYLVTFNGENGELRRIDVKTIWDSL